MASKLHTPISSADAEGVGEMFEVTNYDLNNIPLGENGEVDYSRFLDKQV